MAAMQVRLEENHLTTPHSYSIRFVPRGSADIALRHPKVWVISEDVSTTMFSHIGAESRPAQSR